MNIALRHPRVIHSMTLWHYENLDENRKAEIKSTPVPRRIKKKANRKKWNDDKEEMGMGPAAEKNYYANPKANPLRVWPEYGVLLSSQSKYSTPALTRITLAGIPYYTFVWNNVDWSAVLVSFARNSLVNSTAYSSKGASTAVFHPNTVRSHSVKYTHITRHTTRCIQSHDFLS